MEYDNYDIANRLLELKVSDYSETLLDHDNSTPSLLFVFGKDINNREIYIKLKIRNDKIICISFHYAKHKMEHPYSK